MISDSVVVEEPDDVGEVDSTVAVDILFRYTTAGAAAFAGLREH